MKKSNIKGNVYQLDGSETKSGKGQLIYLHQDLMNELNNYMNGDDKFFGSNVKQNVFNSDSYSKPVWTLFFDQKEITHYIHKIRKINNSDVFKNLVENWLYFTVQDNGLTSIDVFNPVGPDN